MAQESKTDIGLNALGVKMVHAGLTGTPVLVICGAPVWLIMVPVVVTLVGVLICTQSFWWRR